MFAKSKSMGLVRMYSRILLIPSLSSLVVGNCLTEELSVTEIRFRINHFSSPLESLLCIQL